MTLRCSSVLLPVVATWVLATRSAWADPTADEPPPNECTPPDAPARSLSGRVLETMDAGGYTYLRIDVGAEGTWAAVPTATLSGGQCVTLRGPQRMVNFKSSALGRTFPEILFATLQQNSKEAVVSAAHGGAHPAESPAAGPVSVPRAPGPEGRTVAEVLTQRTELAGQVVAVRGRVAKRTDGVLKKNWVHLEDGSVSEATGGTTLIVATSATPEVGTVVVARGKVRLDIDLGFGYRYAVLLDDATVGP